jgi:hypothetical protein
MAFAPGVAKRLLKELAALEASPPEGIRVGQPEDLSIITAYIAGPSGTPFSGGGFRYWDVGMDRTGSRSRRHGLPSFGDLSGTEGLSEWRSSGWEKGLSGKFVSAVKAKADRTCQA